MRISRYNDESECPFINPVCGQCGEYVEAPYEEDLGLGPIEFWGAKSWHHDVQWVGECCEAPLQEAEFDECPRCNEEKIVSSSEWNEENRICTGCFKF